LRAFWVSRHGKPEGSKLFTAFKKEYDTPEKLYHASLHMRRDAERYAALFSRDDPIWAGYSARLRQSVDALSIIGFSQAYGIILAALEKFTRSEMERLLWLIECVAVRHQLIGRRRPGRVESLGGQAARDISRGKITTATEVMGVIRELYVPDEAFRLNFESISESNAKKARYIITGIERESIARDGNTLSDELIPHSVTVEHIFPRSPSPEWRVISNEDHEWEDSLIYRLGNLCLLPGINSSLGNKLWAEKVIIYGKSRLNTTNKLTQYTKWGREEISKRQNYMAEFAVSSWRFH
jgi:hypothetical protein